MSSKKKKKKRRRRLPSPPSIKHLLIREKKGCCSGSGTHIVLPPPHPHPPSVSVSLWLVAPKERKEEKAATTYYVHGEEGTKTVIESAIQIYVHVVHVPDRSMQMQAPEGYLRLPRRITLHYKICCCKAGGSLRTARSIEIYIEASRRLFLSSQKDCGSAKS